MKSTFDFPPQLLQYSDSHQPKNFLGRKPISNLDSISQKHVKKNG